ncbi:MAG: sulfite exporter TauE/SafE family protein, partial [Spirochaetia bacterium]
YLMIYFLLLLLGFIAGIASGLFGIGGGVIIVPSLITITGFSQLMANGTSLAALLLPVGMFAVIVYYHAKRLYLPASLAIALGLAAGAAFGAFVALDLPSLVLKRLYGVFLFYVGLRFLAPWVLVRLVFQQNDRKEKGDRKEVEHLPRKGAKYLPLYLSLGFVAGITSGLFGIGGGAIIVPLLVTAFHLSPKEAVGTSLGALLLPVGLPGVLVYYQSGSLSIVYAACVAFGLMAGAFFGAKTSIKLPAGVIKHLYGAFLLIIAVYFVFQP